ncbi:MAG: DUF3971 domain-containing protein [Cyanobacteria bacterium SIG32]|nr:DUF3971 domain-containing protein [Cyanobacteria bacterium SIG32]
MNNRKKSLICITILTFFYGLYYWGIPAFINIEKRINSIETKIQEKTGVRISIEQPHIKMGHIPAVWFMAENIAVLNDDNSKAVNLEHSAIKIHLLPLLAGKIHIGNFSSDKIDINLIYTTNNKLQIGQYSLPQIPKTKLTLNKAYLRIGNYKINLDDQKQNKNILLDGSFLTLDEFKNNKRIKLATFAKLYVNKRASDIMADVDIKLPFSKITENQFKINGRINNLNLADFSDYVKAIPNSKIQSLSGNVNLVANTISKHNNQKNIFSQLTIENLNISQENPAKSIYCKDILNIKTDVDTIKNGLNIQNMNISSKGINLDINGEITNLDTKTPAINTNININNSRSESFIPLLPGEKDILEEIDFLALKKFPLYGDVKGFLQIKGKTDTPNIDGSLKIANAYLIKPLPHNTPLAKIDLEFKDTKIFFKADVPAPFNQKVTVTGHQDLYNQKLAEVEVKTSDKINLKIAQEVLNPLHEILKFYLGPLPIMDIDGVGNVDLKITGNRKNPHAWGNINFNNATAEFKGINNLVAHNVNGGLNFDDQNIKIDLINAIVNNKPMTINGTASILGDFDIKILSKQQDLNNLLIIIKTSPLLNEIQKLLTPLKSAKGNVDLALNLNGNISDLNNIVFNKNIFAKGNLNLNSNSITIQNIPVSNITGQIKFDNLKANLNLLSNLNNSLIKITGDIDEENTNLKINSDKFILKDGIKLFNFNLPFEDDLGKIQLSFDATYNGLTNEINPLGIYAKGKIGASKGSILSIGNTPFEIKNGQLKNVNIKGLFKNNPYNINLTIANIFSDKQLINGNFNFNKINLENIKDVIKYFGLKDIKDLYGFITLSGQIHNNYIFADANLDDISFEYIPEKLPIKIASGKIKLKKDTLVLNKVNSTLGEMPVFADGSIFNLDKKPTLNIYVNAKPTQKFIDQHFNNKAVYPIKLKGDINCSSNISGTLNALHNKTQLKLAENSSIYYMGATLGSVSDNQSSLITADNIIYPNGIKLNNFIYEKLIPSQNNILHKKTQLTASGYIEVLSNSEVKFDNFKIKTQEPTDAKIFNIIFRKPFMKQGIFTSDITLNGKSITPKILGKLHITSIDMPLFDAIINDIDFDFKKDKIYLNSKGIVLTNNLNISAIIKNNQQLPLIFEDIKFNLDNLDLNKITETLRDYDADSARNLSLNNTNNFVDLNQIIIENSEISAGNIKIKNLEADDFLAHVNLNEKMQVNVEDFKFKTAEGEIKGNIKYNLLNHLVNLSMNVKDTNAQIIAETLFGLKGQIYGIVTGDINLYCNGKSQDLCTQTLGGNGNFSVQNGKMPKLGSLEYLLKAGNLVKSGLTGLSINGIIDLITPHKTGDFDSISGNFHISEGIADNIQIYSSGKELNIYVKGAYNFTNLIADMQIFGALTKNFSTLFGKIANASLNTLFNTIPGINISEAPSIITDDIKKIPNIEDASRMFKAEIYGDINGDNYVKSFKWLK